MDLALRDISVLRINAETGCASGQEKCARSYMSFTPLQLLQCKRRTFWAAYLDPSICAGCFFHHSATDSLSVIVSFGSIQ